MHSRLQMPIACCEHRGSQQQCKRRIRTELRYQKATLLTCMFYVRWLRRNGLGEDPLAIYSTWRGLQQLSDVFLASNAHSLLRAQRFLAALKKRLFRLEIGHQKAPQKRQTPRYGGVRSAEGGSPSGDLVFYTILAETLQLCAIFDMHFWKPAGRGLGEGILILFV